MRLDLDPLLLQRLGDALRDLPWGKVMPAMLLLCITGLAYSAARLTLTLIAPSAAHQAPAALPKPRPSLDPEAIERLAHLDPLSPPRHRTAPQAPVPSAPLAIALKGTSSAGYAILAVQGREGLYRLGEVVMPGVRLQAVARDHVVIAREGREETLWLDGEEPAPAADGAPLPRLIQGIELRPAPGGLKVARLDQGSPLVGLGFAPGDVIRSVNGHPIASLQDLAALYAQNPHVRRLEVGILRGGRPVKLDIALP